MQKDSNTLLTILIILSFLTFTRTLVYIVFSKTGIDLGDHAGINIQKGLDYALLIFSILRLTLATIILSIRHFHNDILTYVLIFFVFSSLQRFYYEYLDSYNSKSQIRQYLKKYQDVNSVLIILSSIYIIKYVLF